MDVSALHVGSVLGSQKCVSGFLDWNYRQLKVAVCELGIESSSSLRAARVLTFESLLQPWVNFLKLKTN